MPELMQSRSAQLQIYFRQGNIHSMQSLKVVTLSVVKESTEFAHIIRPILLHRKGERINKLHHQTNRPPLLYGEGAVGGCDGGREGSDALCAFGRAPLKKRVEQAVDPIVRIGVGDGGSCGEELPDGAGSRPGAHISARRLATRCRLPCEPGSGIASTTMYWK